MKLAELVAVAVLWAGALAFAAPALAETPAQHVYGGPCTSDQTACQPNTSLPFTGINVGVVAALGVVLSGTGFVVRLRLRSSNN